MKLVEKVTEMITSLSDLSQKVVDAGDPIKYARSVEKLNRGVSDTYAQMRQIIVTSATFSEEEKLNRLSELAKQEEESRRQCDEAIRGNREQVAHIVLEVAKGLLTCGIYYVPAITRSLRDKSKKQLPENIPTIIDAQD